MKIIHCAARLAIIAGFMLALCPFPAGAEQQKTFQSTLTESIGGGARKCGEAVFHLIEKGTAIHYRLEVQDLANITMAHLHLGKAGKIGSPVAWLYPESPPPRVIPGNFSGMLCEGVISAADLIGPMRGRSFEDLLTEIGAGRIYVNVHTVEHPESAVSGIVK